MSAPLRLVVQASSDPDQATIATHPDDLSTERYDATYVRLSGYCGPYKPELFAAAPALLAALQDMGARYGLSEQAREALAAAGVEMPKRRSVWPFPSSDPGERYAMAREHQAQQRGAVVNGPEALL